MPKDWIGNSQAVYSTLAASNHSQTDKENYDYYATPSKAVEELLSREQFSKYIRECIWEKGFQGKLTVDWID